MKIINLIDYCENVNQYKHVKYLYDFMFDFYKKYYPNFQDWYWKKMIPETLSENRKILTLIDDNYNIFGVSILKYSKNILHKNKICSFYLHEETKKEGFAKLLMKQSIEDLSVNNPFNDTIITVPEERMFKNTKQNMSKFLNYYNFDIIDIKANRYRQKSNEYILLKSHNSVTNEAEISFDEQTRRNINCTQDLKQF